MVLVSLDWLRTGDPPFGLGTASIAASLRYHGIDVRIVSDAVNRTWFSYESFLARVLGAASEAGPGRIDRHKRIRVVRAGGSNVAEGLGPEV